MNDAVLHGLPHDYMLVDGDLLSVDFAASVDGWVCDSALTVQVGGPREEDQRLVATTQGARRRDRGRAAGQPARRRRPRSARWPGPPATRVNLQFGGHGVGRTMHGDPHVANDGVRARG